jgi:hypothetical protein
VLSGSRSCRVRVRDVCPDQYGAEWAEMNNSTLLTLTTEVLFPSVESDLLENETTTPASKMEAIERSLTTSPENNPTLDVRNNFSNNYESFY